MERVRRVKYSATLIDLMQGYARIRTKDDFRPFVLDRDAIFTMEEALERMRGLIGYVGEWVDLSSYLPDGWSEDPKRRRSATAATFAASLELVKEGKADIRQTETFAPIQLRRRERPREH
jgi:segregation and condensation protein A